jgi:hypothetical protein
MVQWNTQETSRRSCVSYRELAGGDVKCYHSMLRWRQIVLFSVNLARMPDGAPL